MTCPNKTHFFYKKYARACAYEKKNVSLHVNFGYYALFNEVRTKKNTVLWQHNNNPVLFSML